MFREQSAARGEQTGIIDEMVGNQKVVQAFGYQDRALGRFDEVNERLRECSLRAIFFSSITNPSTRFVNSLVYAGVGVAGALSAVQRRHLHRPADKLPQLCQPVYQALQRNFRRGDGAAECAGLRRPHLRAHRGNAADPGARRCEDAHGPRRQRRAWRTSRSPYVPEQHLIEHFDLAAKPGQRVAIVGPTGCGKTTIINLLMRFYDVDSGCIRVSGEDIRDLTRRSLRTSYGMVLQDTWLKTGTIRENIVMGKPDATDEEVIAAAKASHAHGFIRRLPQGL